MSEFFTHSYFLIGIVFYLFRFRKMARGIENATGRFLVRYDWEGPNDPGIISYLGTLLWGPFVIVLWPFWLIMM